MVSRRRASWRCSAARWWRLGPQSAGTATARGPLSADGRTPQGAGHAQHVAPSAAPKTARTTRNPDLRAGGAGTARAPGQSRPPHQVRRPGPACPAPVRRRSHTQHLALLLPHQVTDPASAASIARFAARVPAPAARRSCATRTLPHPCRRPRPAPATLSLLISGQRIIFRRPMRAVDIAACGRMATPRCPGAPWIRLTAPPPHEHQPIGPARRQLHPRHECHRQRAPEQRYYLSECRDRHRYPEQPFRRAPENRQETRAGPRPAPRRPGPASSGRTRPSRRNRQPTQHPAL